MTLTIENCSDRARLQKPTSALKQLRFLNDIIVQNLVALTALRCVVPSFNLKVRIIADTNMVSMETRMERRKAIKST